MDDELKAVIVEEAKKGEKDFGRGRSKQNG